MSQKLPVNGFKLVRELSKFDKRFLKDYDEKSNEWYFLEVDIEHPKKLFNLHIDRPFLPERKTNLKCNKFVCNIYDKENYIVHLRALRQALIQGFTILKKVHRIIQFNPEAWRKPYIDMKTKLNNFEKYFFKIFFFFFWIM